MKKIISLLSLGAVFVGLSMSVSAASANSSLVLSIVNDTDPAIDVNYVAQVASSANKIPFIQQSSKTVNANQQNSRSTSLSQVQDWVEQNNLSSDQLVFSVINLVPYPTAHSPVSPANCTATISIADLLNTLKSGSDYRVTVTLTGSAGAPGTGPSDLLCQVSSKSA